MAYYKSNKKEREIIMKKKLLALILIGVMAMSFTACGGGSKNNESSNESSTSSSPTDLTGVWDSEDNEGSYQEATISDGYIEINWVDADGTSLYLAGTYTAPEKAVKEYTWVSENDKEKTESALLASSDDTKEFTYKNGVISYEASAMGTTTTIKLKRK
jgi:hypothetical protein